MTTISIELKDEIAERLAEEAKRLHISVEQLAALRAERLLARPEESFQTVADRIIADDCELLKRLA